METSLCCIYATRGIYWSFTRLYIESPWDLHLQNWLVVWYKNVEALFSFHLYVNNPNGGDHHTIHIKIAHIGSTLSQFRINSLHTWDNFAEAILFTNPYVFGLREELEHPEGKWYRVNVQTPCRQYLRSRSDPDLWCCEALAAQLHRNRTIYLPLSVERK